MGATLSGRAIRYIFFVVMLSLSKHNKKGCHYYPLRKPNPSFKILLSYKILRF